MLTVEEAELALHAIKLFSTLCIFPIQVDVKSGKIQRQSSKIKVFIWKIVYGICILHWLYMFGRLLQSTVVEPEKYFRWEHFILHFGITFSAGVFHFTGFCLFISNAEENVIIFNQLFSELEDPVQKVIDRLLEIQREKETGNTSEKIQRGSGTQATPETGSATETSPVSTSTREPSEGQPGQHQNQTEVTEHKSEWEIHRGPRPLLTWPLQYSMNEILTKLNFELVGFTIVFVVLILALDPTRPQLLFSSLPPEWQNIWIFLPLLTVEGLCLGIPLAMGGFAVNIQSLFFGKCQLYFKRLSLQLRNFQEHIQNGSLGTGIGGRDIGREIWILRQILKEMKELVLFIELFNGCFPFCIFAWKICCLSISILFYFCVIRQFQEFPFLVLYLAYCASAVTVVHSILYSNAFSIPGKMDDLKSAFLLTAQKTTATPNANKNFQMEMTREIKRIQSVGIKVGSFHQMERESTPVFVDTVINQVVSLLVTFPR